MNSKLKNNLNLSQLRASKDLILDIISLSKLYLN